MMRRVTFFLRRWWVLGLIFLLALGLRLIQLDRIPFGFQHDELYAGYIGRYMVLHNGMDISGHRFPLFFDTFGDFRPIGIFLTSGLATVLFGVNEFAVRFPSAFFGALTIIPLFIIAHWLLRNKAAAYATAGFLALAPWHIVLSRTTSDGVLGLFFAVCGLAVMIAPTHGKRSWQIWAGTVILLLSYFFYHPFRIIAPLLIAPLILVPGYKRRHVVLACIIALLVSVLFLASTSGNGRLVQVLLTKNPVLQSHIISFIAGDGPSRVITARFFHNKPVSYINSFFFQYSDYFSASFLFNQGGLPIRYVVPDVGLFQWIILLPIIFGFLALTRKKWFGSYYILWLLAIAPIPAAVTYEDTPNVHRAIFLIIPLALLAGYGLTQGWEALRKYHFFRIMLISCTSVIFLYETSYFWHQYAIHQRAYKSYYRNDMYRETVQKIAKDQKVFDIIYVPEYESIPLYYLFYQNEFGLPPDMFLPLGVIKEWQNIRFVDSWCPSHTEKNIPENKTILFVDRGDCTQEQEDNRKVIDKIEQSDGARAFTFVQ